MKDRKNGVALLIIIMIIAILTVTSTLVWRSSTTLQAVVGNILGHNKSEAVANIGLQTAIREIERRFTARENPHNSFPRVNAQYRPFLDSRPSAVSAVLRKYAEDIVNITTEDDCAGLQVTGSSGIGKTNYGTSISDRPICLHHDPTTLGYNYEVTLLNREELSRCASDGYTATSCESTLAQYQTRLLDPSCISWHTSHGNWSDPSGSCAPPRSFHHGKLPTSASATSAPALGYRLYLQAISSDNRGRQIKVNKNILLFVETNALQGIIMQGLDIDGINFLSGGHLNGTIVQAIPEYFFTQLLYGLQPPISDYPQHYSLGRRYQQSVLNMSQSYPNSVLDDLQNDLSERYSGMTIKQIITSIAVDPTFSQKASITPSRICEFCDASDTSNETSLLSSLGTFPVATNEAGGFDKNALINKLNLYDNMLSIHSKASNAGGILKISSSITDTLTSISMIDNAGALQTNRSVFMSGNIALTGNTYIDGDLFLKDITFDTNNGKASLIARGNIYIAGNISYSHLPTCSGSDIRRCVGQVSGYNYASACGSQCDNVELVAVGNVVIGNITNAHVAAFLATIVSESAAFWNLDIPALDGLRADDYSEQYPLPLSRAALNGPWSNWQQKFQVGTKSSLSCLDGTIRDPASSVAPGLLPEGSGHIYGDVSNLQHYYWSFFKHATTTLSADTQLPGWGFIRHKSQFPDGQNRPLPLAITNDINGYNVPAAHNGGFLLNDWGSDTVHSKQPWLSSQGFHNLYFDGTTNNAGGLAPAVTANTFDCITDTPPQCDPVGSSSRNWLTTTDLITPKLIAITGFVAGIGGYGPGNGSSSTLQQPLRFWGGTGTTPRMIASDNSTLGGDDAYYIDRDDSATCPGSPASIYDCDENGLTLMNGVYGNIALFTEGGLYIYRLSLSQSITSGARHVKTNQLRYD